MDKEDTYKYHHLESRIKEMERKELKERLDPKVYETYLKVADSLTVWLTAPFLKYGDLEYGHLLWSIVHKFNHEAAKGELKTHDDFVVAAHMMLFMVWNSYCDAYTEPYKLLGRLHWVADNFLMEMR